MCPRGSPARPDRRCTRLTLAAGGALILTAGAARAQLTTGAPPPDEGRDHYTLHATSETTLRVFQRALLPGPNGALVDAETEDPVHQYWSLGVRGLESLGEHDGLDLELWGWVGAGLVEREGQQRFDGDIGSAHATQHLGPAWFRLGRQLVAGGAARYARFDGIAAGVELGDWQHDHARFSTYAGFTVLPRWDARPGYHHLGSAADSLLETPDALPEPSRSGYTLTGVRASYAYASLVGAGLSFHEQEDSGELGRRNLGVDFDVHPSADVSVSGDLVMDLDALRMADLRAFTDVTLDPRTSATVEYLRAEPSLFLSRQSVLSVFATDAYDELGLELRHDPVRQLTLSSGGYVEWYAEDEQGARFNVRGSLDVDRSRTTSVALGYSRVLLSDTGYHALRNSVSHRLPFPLTLRAEAYHYAYDRPIAGHRASTVYTANASWQLNDGFALLWGNSLSTTPYAASDLQTLVRLSFRENSSSAPPLSTGRVK